MIEVKQYWWPLATTAQVQVGKPLSRSLHSVPLVVFRGPSGRAAVLQDRCPHRHAPLSCGWVDNGELVCPYHGWRFDVNGGCSHVPGMAQGTYKESMVPALATREEHGLLWVCAEISENTPEPVRPAIFDGADSFFMTTTANCSMAEAAENFLDGFHTHFVHAGWIRRDSKRQTVKAAIRQLPDGIEARYTDEGLQSGLISSLLESDRVESMGRFRLPGIAEIEYSGRRGLNLLITAWLTPESPSQVRVHAWVATRRGLAPAWMKRMLLRRLFGVILRQDKVILEKTNRNILRFKEAEVDAPLVHSPLDFLGPSIRQLLDGHQLISSVEREVVCQL